MRLDKWLWVARFFKTRALALKAIKQGKVLYEGQKPNPSREVPIGATLTIAQGYEQKIIVVTGLSLQRQNATIAQTLYQETRESIALRTENALKRNAQKLFTQSAPHPEKRPDKMGRRQIRALRRQGDEGD